MPKETDNTPRSSSTQMTQVQQKVHSAQETLRLKHQQMMQNHPDVAAHLDHARQQLQALTSQGRQQASQIMDHAVQKMGLTATNMTRDRIKQPINPDDWLHTRIQKAVFNKGVDLVADNMDKITRGVKHVGGGIMDKMPSATLDMVDPRHLKHIFNNPTLAGRYVDQRATQIKQFGDLVFNTQRFVTNKTQHLKTSLWNAKDHYGQLESGNKLKHGASVFGDLVQEKIAGSLGMAAVTMGLYNLPKARKATNAAMDKTFPKNTMYGKAFRQFPVKFLFSKPLAKIRGNPGMTAAMIGYGLAVSMGKHIANSQELSKSAPDIFKRLTSENREMHASTRHVDIKQATQRTKSSGTKK